MRRLLNFFRMKAVEAEIREELEFHRSQSSGSFGNVTQMYEQAREASTVAWLETFLQDIRYGLRQFRRTPILVSVAVISLALGIGANTAVFTLIDAIMLQWLPVYDPGRLVLFDDSFGTGSTSGLSPKGDIFSYSFWRFLQEHGKSFVGLCAFRGGSDAVLMYIPGTDESGIREPARAELVSGNYFSVLGVEAEAGRVLRAEDDVPGSPDTAVISYNFWIRRFNRDRRVVGRSVILNDGAFTVVGVAARGFFGERISRPPDFWVPLSAQPRILRRESWLPDHHVYWLNMLGRLKHGATIQSAEAAVNVQLHQFYLSEAGTRLSPTVRRSIADAHIALKGGGTGISGLRFLYSEPLRILMAAVAGLLLIACANIATLLLAQASARSREFQSRLALGASRARIFRQVMVEGALLAGLGTLIGLGFAWASLKLLVSAMHASSVVAARPNCAVLGFTAGISVVSTLCFGAFPAFRCSRLDQVRQGPRAGRFGAASALIVTQISLSLVLLMCSGLLAHSLLDLIRQDFGFNPQNVMVVRTDPRLADYTPTELFPLYRELDERLNAVPGVSSADVARFSPASGSVSSCSFSIQGFTPPAGEEMRVYKVEIGPHFFRTLGIPIRLGRGIETRDTPNSPEVAVINETFVRKYFPKQDPIGRRVYLGDRFEPPGIEIVGVAKNSKYYEPKDEFKPMVFLSVWQPHSGEYTYAHEFMLRTSGDPKGVMAEVRRSVNRVSNRLPILEVTTLGRQIEQRMEQQKLVAILCTLFGVMALVLTSAGIYGTVSYSVSRRTSEIGIRMAVGAQWGRVLWMVLQDSLLLVAFGLGVGLPLGLLATRSIRNLLFGVGSTDPLALSASAFLILLLGSFAAFLPARRAAAMDPLTALRRE